jgi:acetyl-CoA carboxylase biotin carboxyl carrier protein
VDLQKLATLVALLKAEDIHEFEHEKDGERVRIVRGGPIQQAQVLMHAPAPGAAAPAAAPMPTDSVDVTSPFVGTFYRSPSPEAKSFVDVGASVKVGQVLCIIEAMKLMNEIESEMSGTILEVYAKNGQAVEFGQKLFRLKKA